MATLDHAGPPCMPHRRPDLDVPTCAPQIIKSAKALDLFAELLAAPSCPQDPDAGCAQVTATHVDGVGAMSSLPLLAPVACQTQLHTLQTLQTPSAPTAASEQPRPMEIFPDAVLGGLLCNKKRSTIDNMCIFDHVFDPTLMVIDQAEVEDVMRRLHTLPEARGYQHAIDGSSTDGTVVPFDIPCRTSVASAMPGAVKCSAPTMVNTEQINFQAAPPQLDWTALAAYVNAMSGYIITTPQLTPSAVAPATFGCVENMFPPVPMVAYQATAKDGLDFLAQPMPTPTPILLPPTVTLPTPTPTPTPILSMPLVSTAPPILPGCSRLEPKYQPRVGQVVDGMSSRKKNLARGHQQRQRQRVRQQHSEQRAVDHPPTVHGPSFAAQTSRSSSPSSAGTHRHSTASTRSERSPRAARSVQQNGVRRSSIFCDWKGCHKHFSQLGNLNRHRRKHTGDTRYACTAHTVSEGGRFGSVPCRKRFVQKAHMLTHMDICENKKYGCDLIDECSKGRGLPCTKRFASSGARASHKNKNHKNWRRRIGNLGCLEGVKKGVEARQVRGGAVGYWGDHFTARDAQTVTAILDAIHSDKLLARTRRQ